MKRIISLLAMTVLLGAGCTPDAAPVPVSPVVSSTPAVVAPTVPDFAKDWSLYRSNQFGFTFRYPFVKRSGQEGEVGPRTLWLGETVVNPDKKSAPTMWLDVLLLASDNKSLKNHFYHTDGWTETPDSSAHVEPINGIDWYVTETGDGAAGTFHSTRSYVTTIGYTHVVLRFTRKSHSCSAYAQNEAGDDGDKYCIDATEQDFDLAKHIVETYTPKPE